MTVQELIDKLQEVKDKSRIVIIEPTVTEDKALYTTMDDIRQEASVSSVEIYKPKIKPYFFLESLSNVLILS